MAVIWAEASANASGVVDAASVRERDGFRPEVQGLRALAVMAVVLFHLWPDAVPGGFIGVDVFFVISGYLITGLLFRQLQQTGRISLTQFYARRAKRLLPAATLVLLVVAFATPLLPPARWDDTSLGIIASALYVENWHLASLAVDYLASEDAPSPVQHYWSLSIEEQFYLIWPLIMIGASALAFCSASLRRRLMLPLAAIFVLSLGASVSLTAIDRAAAYFVTHTRLWELGLGAMLAIAPMPALSSAIREGIRAIGVSMILIAAFAFSGQTPFPGTAALLPTLGCALILAAGPQAGQWSVLRLFAAPPAQFLGDISYSLYLWHWPVIVFAGLYDPDQIGIALGLALLAFAVLLSALTKRFVEDPIRYGRLGNWKALAFGAASIAACAVTASLIHKYVGLEVIRSFEGSPDYPGAQAFLSNAPVPQVDSPIPPLKLMKKDKPVAYGRDCHLSWDATALNPCVFGRVDGPRVVLMGDSHAANWLPPLMAIAEEQGWRLESHTKSSCMVLKQPILRREEPFTHCREWGANLLDSLRASPPALVIFTQHRFHKLADGKGKPDAEATGTALADMWRELRGLGIQVVGILDTPSLIDSPEKCILQDPACSMDAAKVLEGEDPIRVAQRQVPGATVIDMNDALCRGGNCPMIIGNVVAWRDRHHLTASFTRTLTATLKQRLIAAIGQPSPLIRESRLH